MLEEQRKARSRLAAATAKANRDPAAQAEVDKARQEYRYVSAQEYVRQLVDTWPPLTDEQRDRLALLLRGTAA